MGLVDYSDSESESESVQQKPTSASAPLKKSFQKLLDRSSGAGKIVVNLPSASAAADPGPEDGQPPAKRVKTVGGSRFSGLGSFLPPPKKTAAAASAPAAWKGGSAPAPGVHLRTGAEPAFVRGGSGAYGPVDTRGQKPEEEVKLVGKPLMFKPLSVARKKAPVKNKKKALPAVAANTPPNPPPHTGSTTVTPAAAPSVEPPKKKVSLFSMSDDEPTSAVSTTIAPTGIYEPMFGAMSDPTSTANYDDEDTDVTSAYPIYQQSLAPSTSSSTTHDPTFSNLADTLSTAARRELFGRSDPSALIPPNAKVISFDMEREYAHNEALRASGAQQVYNPVRSIVPGKHSLRQVVNMAQSNQGALEESFARAKSNQKDAAGRYGWK
ncbi:Anaphase-promoting complex subunit 23 [Collariella sp. IMI 366227]|nr:Anaphase-promoting complex subunit 23 [Collariella sp. IMI 366227]